MNLRIKFRFWPVNIVGVIDGWIYGTYVSLRSLGHRDLLEKGLIKSRRRKKAFTDKQVGDSFAPHETLLTALDSRIPLEETVLFEESRLFEPSTFVDEKRATEAFLDFMNLAEGDDDGAIQYMRTFGAFDDYRFENENLVDLEIPEPIQRFCKMSMKEGPYVVRLSSFWAVRDELKGLRDLSLTLEKKQLGEIQAHCRRRRPEEDYGPHTDWLALGRAILSADLTSSLNPQGHRNPRLCLAVQDGQLMAMTIGKSVRSALYLTLLQMIISKTQYRRCLRCKRHFVPRASGGKPQTYCPGGACRNAAKVKRFRIKADKQKEQLEKRTSRYIRNR